MGPDRSLDRLPLVCPAACSAILPPGVGACSLKRMSDLAKKLLIKPGYKIALVNPPSGYQQRLEPLPEGASLVKATTSGLDFLQVFVQGSAELKALDEGVFAQVKSDGLVWICYPKGGKTGLNRDSLWKAMDKKGLVGVTLVAIDGTWSAMRFRAPDHVGR
jgi:hypothetical protein